MARHVLALILAGFCVQASASALMDVSPGDTLSRVKTVHARQALYQKQGMATFVDMHDRYPAFVFLDVGALDTIVGTAWMSLGSESSQKDLFQALAKRFEDKGNAALREDEVQSCMSLPGGRAFQLHTSMRVFSEGTTMMFTQAPTFSSTSLLRGSALQANFELPNLATEADQLNAHSQDLNAYQKAWNIAFQTQMRGAMTGFAQMPWCSLPDKLELPAQPIATGKAPSPDQAQHPDKVPVTWHYEGVTFTQARLSVRKDLIDAVQYDASAVSTQTFADLRKAMEKRYGKPSLEDQSKEGAEQHTRLAWNTRGEQGSAITVHFTQNTAGSAGSLDLAFSVHGE